MTLGLVLGVFATASWAQTGALFEAGAYADYQPDLENGRTMYYAAGCATCHAVDGDDTILAGGQEMSTRFGELYAPNITHHKAAGIGDWSNATFLNAVLRGTSPDGDKYFGAVFPYPSYGRMRPEDALDMKAFMAELPTADAKSREHNISYMSEFVLDKFSSSRGPLTAVSDPQMARGQYLVEAVGHCAECHTPRDTGLGFKYELDNTRAYEGEFGLLGEYAPDITADRLAKFPMENFVIGALTEAKKLNGNPMTSPSMRRIARQTAQLASADRAAIYAYLSGTNVDVETLPGGNKVTPPIVINTPADETDTPSGGTDTPVRVAEADPIPDHPVVEEVAEESGEDVIEDHTGAERLMKRVEAYCESTEPLEPVMPPPAETAEAPAAPKTAPPAAVAKKGVDPQLVAAADQIIEDYCRACHAPGKTYNGVFPTGDIADMKFDDRILIPGNPEKSPIYESVAAGRMPTGKKMSKDELEVLHKWIVALGEPEMPAAAPAPAPVAEASGSDRVPVPPVAAVPHEELPPPLFAGFSREERMLAIARDINDVEKRDRQYMRYFTFAEMPLAEVDCGAVGALKNPMHYMHAGFNKLINSMSNGRSVVPVHPVPNTEGAVVRIDLRDYEWTFDDWLSLSTGVFTEEVENADFDEEAWEDLASVYPYGVDPAYDPLLKTVADATGAFVPIMRADWVARFASQSPYYDILLDLTADIRDIEDRIGVDADREIDELQVIRAGMLPGSSGVSDHNRMLERFDLPRDGYYWKSYDFAGSHGEQSLELHPDGPKELARTPSGTSPFEHDGGEMIFSLPNGLQGYYLSTNLGERLLVGPASIVSFRTKPIGKGVEVVNARSCFDCHDNGMINKKDEVRDALMSSQRFSRDELEVLLELYVENDELDEYYAQDRASFLSALAELNATSMTAGGQMASLRAPNSVGGGEIVTYLADMHFHALDVRQLARDFYLDEDTFRVRARQMGDPTLTVVVGDWLSRLDAGGKIQRSEVEKYYADILERMTDLRPYRPAESYAEVKHEPEEYAEGALEKEVEKAVEEVVEKEDVVYKPAVTEPVKYAPPAEEAKKDKLTLAIHVDQNDYYIDDLLEFTIEASHKCELQMFYVEESKNIEELPGALLGPQFLEAGEKRKIPYEGSGLRIRFDEPGKGETMLAYCRMGGLGDQKMTAEGALDYAKSRFQPLTRGIAIEAAERVQEDGGQSATNHVTFEVFE
ncbi:cytochrome c [Marinovum sp. 2_MG-2023]|uniref:c-type cytochrome n=1 Tax=unclassified Marinovum TaxID=2647166 RepID=UPI0026E2F53F|nr:MULTISPECIES: cytochrome c [unclassified Marinovum]MDO6728615.1 cytochrome c [Marinovum sp. 2_MG-2023]MDO6777969.1 cytochrome c [Marinovum sp. 1_MG-2023]